MVPGTLLVLVLAETKLDSLRRLLWMTNFAESFICHFLCLCNSAFKF